MPSINKTPDENFVASTANPLARYFRAPGVHVRLPTGGAFMPAGSIETSMNGEIAVLPMRSADELLLKSADALMNGYAIEELIRSCVPAIKEPRLVSSPDLDVIFLAVKSATYGDVITMEPICPSCNEQNEVHQSLAHLFATCKPIQPENPVRLSDDVVAYLRPYNLHNATTIGLVSFQEARKVQAAEAATDMEQEARQKQVNESVQRLVELTLEMLAECVERVVVQEGEVRDRAMIREFVANISKAWVDRLQSKLDEINGLGIDKTYQAKCAACGHEWSPSIEFNPSTFFAPSSSV